MHPQLTLSAEETVVKGVEALEDVNRAGLLLRHDDADRVKPLLLDVHENHLSPCRHDVVLVNVDAAPSKQHALV